jgi:hypothetical protein
MNEGLDKIQERVEKVKIEILELSERLEILNSGDSDIIEVCAKALQKEANNEDKNATK